MPTTIIQIDDLLFEPLIYSSAIEHRIRTMANEIAVEYADKNPLFIVVLNGAFMFAAQLMKHTSILSEITFIRVESYKKTESRGEVKEILGLKEPIEGRHIVVLEDIVDTGLTLSKILEQLILQKPASLRVATLLQKPDALIANVSVDYLGFNIENRFVLGYGLDYEGHGRNLPEIYVLKGK